jgi:hypothetical protein
MGYDHIVAKGAKGSFIFFGTKSYGLFPLLFDSFYSRYLLLFG